jgi:hypothetical protein
MLPLGGLHGKHAVQCGIWVPTQHLKLQLQLIYDRQSVGQSVLVSGAHLGPVTNFSFAMKFPVGSCALVDYSIYYVESGTIEVVVVTLGNVRGGTQK